MSELTPEERDEFAAVLAAANRPNLTNDAAIAAERASWLWVADALDGTLARIVAERARAAVADAWDEGYEAGSDDMFSTRNPYRAALSAAEGTPEASEGARGAVEGAREGNEG